MGGYFYTAFLTACKENLCFSGSSVPVSLFLIIQGETSKVGHMVTKRQNWGIVRFYDAQNDPNCCSFKDQKEKQWDLSADLARDKVLVMG